MARVVLTVQKLTVRRHKKNLLEDIDFELREHETLSIIGAKGAGKGFLLKTLMGIQDGVVAGKVVVAGDVKLGLVSMAYPCVPRLSVFENLSLPLKLMGVHSRSFMGEEVENVLKSVEIWPEVKHSLHQKVLHFNEFQRMRLNLARTLLFKPSVLLLDKPTQGLDPVEKAHYEAIINKIKSLASVIWVSHDLEQAARVSDKILFLKNGRVIEFGACEDIFTMPQNAETENFISRRVNV